MSDRVVVIRPEPERVVVIGNVVAGAATAHPDLAAHDALGLATQLELNAKADINHGHPAPDLSTYVSHDGTPAIGDWLKVKSVNPLVVEKAAAPSGGGGLLAYHEYAVPAAISTSSTTLVDVDATNLAITFTVPASGNVLVSLSAVVNTGAIEYWWGLREGTAVVAASDVFMDYGGDYTRLVYRRRFTGLTVGTKTWKWAHRAVGGGRSINGSADGTRWAFMEVWTA